MPDIFIGKKNLSLIKGNRPSRYIINMADAIFTEDELINGIIEPERRSGCRVVLTDERVRCMKECILARFPYTTSWLEAKAAFNQHGLDLRKRRNKEQ